MTWAGDITVGELGAYTDKAIGEYMANAKASMVETRFSSFADHPAVISKPAQSGSFRVPLLFYGNVLKEEFRGDKNGCVSSQTDMIATLLRN